MGPRLGPTLAGGRLPTINMLIGTVLARRINMCAGRGDGGSLDRSATVLFDGRAGP